MALEVKIDKGKIKREGKLYLIFAIIFSVMVYFFYSTGEKSYKSISKILKETKDINADISSLDTKILSLKSIKESNVTDINSLNIAFQPEDPSLFMYSQLKSLSLTNNVEIINFAFSDGTAVGEISVGVISLTVRGNKDSVFNFVTGLGRIAPLSGLGPMSFSNYAASGEVFELDIMIDIYYSPLPKELPDAGKVINPLTQEEEEIYKKLTALEIMAKSDFKAQEPNDNLGDPFIGQEIIPPIEE